jgi:hypothetical protein
LVQEKMLDFRQIPPNKFALPAIQNRLKI